MEKFKEALQNCDTVKVILTGVGETEFSTKELYESIQELERLAEIGRAFEKALKEEYGFINFTRYAGAVPEKWELKESEYNDVLEWAKASITRKRRSELNE